MANQINKWLMGRSEPTPRKHGRRPLHITRRSDRSSCGQSGVAGSLWAPPGVIVPLLGGLFTFGLSRDPSLQKLALIGWSSR